ncbi:MAG: DUF3604 domain-containing protein [Alphaproteobacteria bacterium]|nr:DUF3604 domain-containing protein [Alphaproteobacteria bacterium]
MPRAASVLGFALPALLAALPAPAAEPSDEVAARAQTQLLFGDLHLHTGWSFDAFTFKTLATPDDAYRFAQGEAVAQPLGMTFRLDRPLDFLAVTDHAEYMGLSRAMRDPKSPVSRLPLARQALDPDPNVSGKAFSLFTRALATGDAKMLGDDKGEIAKAVADSWALAKDAANRHNRPGAFTALIAYEWTASPGYNLHRNVIFADDDAPQPFTSLDSQRPEDLWDWLEAERAEGVKVLAIPHNMNMSEGNAFALVDSDGRPLGADYAARRTRNEPVAEVTQVKGTSETHPTLSPNDEFADFEILEVPGGGTKRISVFAGGYARDGLMRGLALQDAMGFNAFRFGFVGATDSHVGMSAIDETDYTGSSGVADGTPELRLDCKYCKGFADQRARSAAGLTAVWARANTRDDIFDAIARKESYATTGTRMAVRFFAGPDLAGIAPGTDGWVEAAYRAGVPMGGDLKAGDRPPVFLVWARKDVEGANLDRIQIVKLWSRDGKAQEEVFDVALSGGREVDPRTGRAPPVGNTVDARTATYDNTIGAAALAARWRDPEFDPALPAAYYVRVLEIPTPRWTTYDAARLGREPPDGLPATIQERAYTSAIWVDPPAP